MKKLKELLKNKLTKKQLEILPSSFDVVGDLSCNTLQLQSPSDKLTEILNKTEQINFGSVLGHSVATYDAIVSGALLGSFNTVIVNTPDILNDAFLIDGVVTSNDTVSLKLHNTGSGSQTAITATYRITVLQFT